MNGSATRNRVQTAHSQSFTNTNSTHGKDKNVGSNSASSQPPRALGLPKSNPASGMFHNTAAGAASSVTEDSALGSNQNLNKNNESILFKASAISDTSAFSSSISDSSSLRSSFKGSMGSFDDADPILHTSDSEDEDSWQDYLRHQALQVYNGQIINPAKKEETNLKANVKKALLQKKDIACDSKKNNQNSLSFVPTTATKSFNELNAPLPSSAVHANDPLKLSASIAPQPKVVTLSKQKIEIKPQKTSASQFVFQKVKSLMSYFSLVRHPGRFFCLATGVSATASVLTTVGLTVLKVFAAPISIPLFIFGILYKAAGKLRARALFTSAVSLTLSSLALFKATVLAAISSAPTWLGGSILGGILAIVPIGGWIALGVMGIGLLGYGLYRRLKPHEGFRGFYLKSKEKDSEIYSIIKQQGGGYHTYIFASYIAYKLQPRVDRENHIRMCGGKEPTWLDKAISIFAAPKYVAIVLLRKLTKQFLPKDKK